MVDVHRTLCQRIGGIRIAGGDMLKQPRLGLHAVELRVSLQCTNKSEEQRTGLYVRPKE